MNRLAALIIVGGLLVISPSQAQDSTKAIPSDSASHQNEARPHERAPDETVLVKLLNTGQTDEEAEYGQEQIERQTEAQRWSAWSTGIMAFLAAVTAGIALIQLKAFWGQSRLAREALEQSRNANEQSRHASEATLSQMQSEEERRLRAYVFVEAAKIGEVSRTRLLPGPMCALVIKNAGQTPAYELSCEVGLVVGQYREMPLRSPPTIRVVEHGAHVGPGGVIHVSAVSGERHHLAPQASSSEAYRVCGVIKYLDAFRYPRETKFSLSFSFIDDVAGSGLFRSDREGNEAT